MNELKDAIRNRTVIAYTGHTDILPAHLPLVRKKLSEKLDTLIQKDTGNYVLITGLEEGTKSGIIEEAVRKEIPLLVLTVHESDSEKARELKEKNAQHIITVIQITDGEEQDIQQAFTDALTTDTDIMIAVWDGLYDTRASNTAFIIDRFLHCTFRSFAKRKKTVYLHQLTARHAANLFPVGRYSDDIDADLPQTVPLQWITTAALKKSKIWDRGAGKKIKHFFTREFPNSDAIVFRYIFPIVLAASVLCFGMIGFLHRYTDKVHGTRLNAFFFAGNLITLNTSVFDFPASDVFSTINIARILGAVLAAYAFFLAFTLALGYENFRRLRFSVIRRFFKRKYSVVIGLNELSFYITQNLRRRTRVIMLYNDAENAYLQRCKDLGAWMIKGHAASESALRKVHFEKSEQVYITSDNEEENFRCIQEMDQLVTAGKVKDNTAEWYVHLPGSLQRNTLQEIVRSSNRSVLTSFYIPENTAERLLIKFPLNRYTQKKQSRMRAIIFGFTDIAKQLLIAILQQGVYTDNKELHIHVYHDSSEQEAVAKFKKTYRFLFPGEKDEMPPCNIWQRITGNPVVIRFATFEPDVDLLPDNASLSGWLSHDATLSFYVCLGSGIRNASFLFLFLPRLNYLFSQPHNCDVAVFWFYNFSDKDEETYLQKKLAALAPHLLTESFGNYLSETTLQAINNQTMNHMARQVALWYYFAYDYKSDSERNLPALDDILTGLLEKEGLSAVYEDIKNLDYKEAFHKKIDIQKRIWYKAITDTIDTGEKLREAMKECWKTLSETDREGNRQAANHIWVKLTEANISWELSDNNRIPSFEELDSFWQENEKESLSILEHRRWDTMKLLEGWQPFAGTGDEWKQHKELLKKQRVHNLLVPFDDLPENERDKDHHQIEGIPFFLSFYFRQKLGKQIVLTKSLSA